jgi:hypothetical protein
MESGKHRIYLYMMIPMKNLKTKSIFIFSSHNFQEEECVTHYIDRSIKTYTPDLVEKQFEPKIKPEINCTTLYLETSDPRPAFTGNDFFIF